MSIEKRKKIIQDHIDINSAKILEIGALDSPTYEKSELDIKYLDYASTDELSRAGEGNPRHLLHTLVYVDYVCPVPAYSSYISSKFDLVIANHVIEHIPDTIRWFREIYKIINDEGILFLSIPDKRYTFDIARDTTNFIDLLRIYDEKIQKPTFYQILEHFYFHKNVSAKEAWSNNVGEKINQKRFDINKAIAVAKKHANEQYADVHCHVYTDSSFRELIKNLIELKLCDFQVIQTIDTQKGSNEFYAVLQKV